MKIHRGHVGLALLIAVTTLVTSGCSEPPRAEAPAAEDRTESNKIVVRKMTDAINARDLAALSEFVAPDVHRYSGATPDLRVESLTDFIALLEQDLSSIPDSHQEINLILAEDDLVAVHVTYSGTQTGNFGPFPPSGRRLELPFVGILRLAEGKIVEIHVEWDNLNALTQLGHFPPPESAEGAEPR